MFIQTQVRNRDRGTRSEKKTRNRTGDYEHEAAWWANRGTRIRRPSKSRTRQFRAVNTPLASLVYTETKMSTHKDFEAGNELGSLRMVRYNHSMNATPPGSERWQFPAHHCSTPPPIPAHRLVHTPHTATSGNGRFPLVNGTLGERRAVEIDHKTHFSLAQIFGPYLGNPFPWPLPP